jgi:hypothetical protein
MPYYYAYHVDDAPAVLIFTQLTMTVENSRRHPELATSASVQS